jgi:hypothetical protein
MSTTTTVPRRVSRARFSASDRPIPPGFDLRAFIEARRAKRETRAPAGAPRARLARWLESVAVRVAGVRRSATLALTLLLTTGVGRSAVDDPTAGARA